MLHVREIIPTRSALKDFVKYPLTQYKGDPNFVLQPVDQLVRGLLGRHNALILNGVQKFLMAYDGETPVGRVLAGIDFRVMQRLGERQGYISLFECVDDQNVANALFEAAKVFLKVNGITSIVGPNPAMFDDFGVGLLVQGFDTPPTYLCPYNPPYYAKLFERAGFVKHHDHFAYDMPPERLEDSRYESVLRRAGKRFGYRVEHVNLAHDLKRRAREFARVMAESTPPEWNTIPPTSETLYRELKNIRHILFPDYVLMAYAGERPVGLLMVVPDLNPVLRGLGGRMFPIGTFRMIFSRSYIKRLRTVLLYVVPEYQNKGVEAVMIQRAYEAARRNGVKSVEASMIDEKNLKIQLAVGKSGGTITKVYRQYKLMI